jgi:hypothetical protein
MHLDQYYDSTIIVTAFTVFSISLQRRGNLFFFFGGVIDDDDDDHFDKYGGVGGGSVVGSIIISSKTIIRVCSFAYISTNTDAAVDSENTYLGRS